ncbi:MAG: DUF2252 family protein [Deltaproteobacteria bacterium]|nr:DUF2252 family protein [Deltaproteobacteria bacterium]
MKIPKPSERSKVLIAKRELKMARSAHAFVRGSTDQFYTWLASPQTTTIPAGPPVWICGDCHIGNLGPIGHVEGHSVVEMRDLDQTVIGNPAHDLVRLALSLAMSARSSDLPGVTTARITEDLVAGYENAFDGEEVSEAIEDLPMPIRLVMKRAVKRTSKRLLDERIGGERKFPLGKQFWPLSKQEYTAVEKLVEQEPIRKLITRLEDRDAARPVHLADAAFWVKGCSSLGLWRVAALVEFHTEKKHRPRLALLDIKQAIEARAPWAPDVNPGVSPGVRVVMGARHLAPALGSRMLAASMLERSVFIRELLPQDLKVELDQIDAEDARAVAYYLGKVVGRAHRRQMDGAASKAWRAELTRHRTKTLDAPSWLWRALVQLVGLHEHAYLEHCRRYALAAAPSVAPAHT